MADSASSSSGLVSGGINFAGLGSGTDFNQITEQLIAVESINKQRLETWKAEWQEKLEALQELNSSLLSLKTTLQKMDTPAEFLVKKSVSSNETLLTVTAQPGAENGSHSIEINQLAQNSIFTGNSGFAETSSNIASGGSGTFVYTYTDPDNEAGATTVTIDVASNTTLEGLKNLINNDPENAGVRASIVSDGTSNYLQLRGLDQGADAELSIGGGTLTGFTSSDFTEVQANQDAQIKVDGWPSGSGAWIESSSNTITSAIDGLTLNLRGSSPGSTVTVSTETDTEAIKANINKFVEQVNEVRSIFKELTKFDATQKEGSVMTGNYGVQLVDSQLKSLISTTPPGFANYDDSVSPATGDRYSVLSQLGILTDGEEGSVTQGLLIFDTEEFNQTESGESRLDEALRLYPDEVANFFAADNDGSQSVDSGSFGFHSQFNTEPGTYDISYDIDASGNITNVSVSGSTAFSIDNDEHTVTINDGDAAGMVFTVYDLTPSSSGSGQIHLQQGKIPELVAKLDDLTNPYIDNFWLLSEGDRPGPLIIIEQNYKDIIENIDKKIDAESRRLALKERELKNKFARLEATLGQYNSQQQAMAGQISQLGGG